VGSSAAAGLSMSFGAGAKSFPPHAIRMTCDVPGGPIEAPDTGYPIDRSGVVMHFTSMRTNPIRPHRAMTAHQSFAHSHAPDRRRCQHRQLGMGGKGGGSGLGGAKIDTDSVRMTYLRTSNVDLTPRIKPFVQTSGIEFGMSNCRRVVKKRCELKSSRDAGGRVGC
jgi:hypothetical protein